MSEEESRKEKDKRVEEIMNNMRLKNQRYLQRHEEVEKDRIEAEKQGSAITKIVPKVDNQVKKTSDVPQIRQEREWDQGKTTEGDWSNFRRTHGRAPRASDSNWRRPDDADKKYNQRSSFDSNKRTQIQESRQFGSSFQRSRGFNRRSDSFYKYPQNWRTEQRKIVKAEDSPKLIKEHEDKVWRDEDDNDEEKIKQKRVVKWLDTLKEVKQWETETPINVCEDKEDKCLQDKPQSSWDDQSAKEEAHLSKKTGKYESEATDSGSTDVKWENIPHKYKPHHGEHSTNVKESEYCNKTKFDRMLMTKKNYASLDLSRPGIKQPTYQEKSEQKLYTEENNSDRMLMAKKNYASLDLSRPGSKQPTYQGRREQKLYTEDNNSEKQPKWDYLEPDNKEDRKICIDNDDRSNRKERSGYEEDNDNRKNMGVMKTSGKYADQRPNYPRGRGRSRGFGSNWNVDKSQRNIERRQVGAKPATGKKTDYHHNINQGKIPSRSNNYKTKYQPKKTCQVKKSEGKWSDEETGDLQLEYRKPRFQRERSKNYGDNKAKKVVKERESEGIWSDLDTDESRLEYERYIKEGKKCPRTKIYKDKSGKVFQEESDGIWSDQEAERAEFSEKAYEVKYTAKNNMQQRTENTEDINENITNLNKDMKKKEDIIKDAGTDKHKHQSDISDVNSYAMFSSQLDKGIIGRPYSVDITEKKDLEIACDMETVLKETDIEFVKDSLKNLKIDSQAQLTSTPTEVCKKTNTETYRDVEDTQNITETSENKYMTAKSEFSTVTSYFDVCSDENSKLQQSSSKISSPIVSIDNTTYIVKDPKIIQSQSAKSSGKINKTYTVENPTILPGHSVEEKELLPKSKNSQEKSTSAFKGSSKDCKSDQKDN